MFQILISPGLKSGAICILSPSPHHALVPSASQHPPRYIKNNLRVSAPPAGGKILCISACSAGGSFHIHNLPDLHLTVIPGSDDIKTRRKVRGRVIKMVFAGGMIGKSYPVHDGNLSSDPLSALNVRPLLTV